MTTTPWGWWRRIHAAEDNTSQQLWSELLGPAGDVVVDADMPDRADCCPGRVSVRVRVARRGGSTRRADLYLCQHHYRSAREHLTRDGAAVFDRYGVLIGPDVSHVPDDGDVPGPSGRDAGPRLAGDRG